MFKEANYVQQDLFMIFGSFRPFGAANRFVIELGALFHVRGSGFSRSGFGIFLFFGTID